MRIVAIVGISGSGKTTVAEGLIAALRREGQRVASAKYIACGREHGRPGQEAGAPFTIDTPGSNSYRHRQAGSQLVVTRAAAETAVLFQRELPLPRLLPFFAGYDYLVLEGDYDAPVPRIVTGWGEEDAAERIDRRTFAVSGRAAAGRSSLLGLPAFDVTTPKGALELARLAAQKAAPWPGPDLPAVTFRDREGRELPLPPWLEEGLAALLAGGELPAGGELAVRLPGEVSP